MDGLEEAEYYVAHNCGEANGIIRDLLARITELEEKKWKAEEWKELSKDWQRRLKDADRLNVRLKGRIAELEQIQKQAQCIELGCRLVNMVAHVDDGNMDCFDFVKFNAMTDKIAELEQSAATIREERDAAIKLWCNKTDEVATVRRDALEEAARIAGESGICECDTDTTDICAYHFIADAIRKAAENAPILP